MILLVGSQKGGSGKSTIAVNLCASLARNGHNVLLVDADRQATAENWATDREENKSLVSVSFVQKYDDITNTVLDLNKYYDYIIIDAAGRDSKELRTGMLAADVLLIPFRPSQPDLDTLPNVVSIIDQAKEINEKLKVFAVLSMAPTNPIVKEIGEAKEYLANYPEITLLDSVIRDRKVFRDAMSFGKGVSEMNNTKAKLEIDALLKELV